MNRIEAILNLKFNCSSWTKVKVEYAYEGDCRACFIFYEVTCKKCLSVYVGNPQNTLKKEWNNISKMWLKKYSIIKFRILSAVK